MVHAGKERPAPSCRFHHPLRADHAFRRCKRGFCFSRKQFRVSHSKPDNAYARRNGYSKPGSKVLHKLRKAHAALLWRPADDEHGGAFPARCRNLFGKAAAWAGILGNKVLCLRHANDRTVEFFAEWSLHRDDVRGRNTRRFTGGERALHGQHPRIEPFTVIRNFRKRQKLLAAGRQKDVPFRAFEAFRRLRNGRGIGRLSHRAFFFPHKPNDFNAGFACGRRNIPGCLRRKGVRCVHHESEPFARKERRHLRTVKPTRMHRDVAALWNERLPVFRCNRNINRKRRFPQKLHKPPPFSGSCE